MKNMKQEKWTVYLSGEIHTDWRQQIAAGVDKSNLQVTLLGPSGNGKKKIIVAKTIHSSSRHTIGLTAFF